MSLAQDATPAIGSSDLTSISTASVIHPTTIQSIMAKVARAA
jgi:hypothetical protein